MADNNNQNQNINWRDNLSKDIIESYTEADLTRDSLELERINENSTVGEMIETINANFRNIAIHGGGPTGLNGLDGMDGMDGTNVEYIYCLCDVMNPDEQYPSTPEGMETLFNRVHFSESAEFPENNPNVTWWEHALEISAEHKNEYVLIRYKIAGIWAYAEKPVLWAHWGESGTDGDGVEYIFLTSKYEFTNSQLSSLILKKVNMDRYQAAIFQINDFYPGKDWFVDEHKQAAKDALTNAGATLTNNVFNEKWRNYFGFFTEYSWSDNPSGTSPLAPYEYVAIRRSKTDSEGKKEWTDYSIPTLWSNYGLSTRTFIVYYNGTEERPQPPRGGWWDVDSDTLVTVKQNHELLPKGWKDKDIDEEGAIVWMSTGIFAHSGENVSWTTPIRITGKDGEKGEDGALIEFIYALSDKMEIGQNYPQPGENNINWDNLFDTIEDPSNPKGGYIVRRYPQNDPNGIPYVTYNGTEWYDRARSISASKKIEYVWIRTRVGTTGKWTYTEPTIWAKWGEDGTDGDGVEYIFHTSQEKHCDRPPRIADFDNITVNGVPDPDLSKCCKAIFQISDFYPSAAWFTIEHQEKARTFVTKYTDFEVTSDLLNNKWEALKTYFDLGWTDNPTGTDLANPYEYVCIRKSTTDENGIKTWGDFSVPALWSNYSDSSRIFIVYCNTEDGDEPEKPTGGVWNKDRDLFIIDDPQHPLTGGWTDEDIESEGKITWMSSGIFHEDDYTEEGKVPQWSEPHRITGADGEKGADGSNIEFIYALCNVNQMLETVHYPAPGDNNQNWKNLFDRIEDIDNVEIVLPEGASVYEDPETHEKCIQYSDGNGHIVYWHDRAQSISEEDKIEYCWSRFKALDTSDWQYDPAPFIWARWGEDGTDGDGIEYIFTLSDDEASDDEEMEFNNWDTHTNVDGISNIAYDIYSLSDFLPNSTWFRNENKTKVRTKLEQKGNVYTDSEFNTAWDELRVKFSFDKIDLGTWTDNPGHVSPAHQYQYVSIRKCVDGYWGAFSEPKVWANYSVNKITSFVFAAVRPDEDLSRCVLSGGDYKNPKPDTTKIGTTILDIEWTDGPRPVGEKTEIWMSSAKLYEDYVPKADETYPDWSTPQRMADRSDMNVEWSADTLTISEVNDLNTALNNQAYNFGTFWSANGYDDGEAEAEAAWRTKVYTDLGVTFSDNAANAVLMATCKRKNGEWTNWKVTRVKGEKGDAGTSIVLKGRIKYVVQLAEGVDYTYNNARNAVLNAQFETAPAEGEMILVVSKQDENNVDQIFLGDIDDVSRCLYIWKYTNGQWVDHNEHDGTDNGEDLNNTYETEEFLHLILWDGDTWQDLGEIHGPEGPVTNVLIKFANDDFTDPEHPEGKKVFVVNEEDIPNAEYIGFLTYTDGLENPDSFHEDDPRWVWSEFRGQDGYGFEFIYQRTSTFDEPSVPETTPTQDHTEGIVPLEWYDEPLEPNENERYVWMCWRKYDTSGVPKWTKFMGRGGHTAAENGVARLWQVYANAILSVDEYYHADTSISPNFPSYGVVNHYPEGWSDFWHAKGIVVGNSAPEYANYAWNSTRRYLFNVEVMIFTDGTIKILEPHYISVYADGITDVIDYYILDNDGSTAPALDRNNDPIISAQNPSDHEGLDFWTIHVDRIQISEEHKYLWNVSKKLYEDGTDDWSTPIVIGVFGMGERSVYIDLDNEMDVVQIKGNREVILDTPREFKAHISMYSGSKKINMRKVEISSEENFGNKLKVYRHYKNPFDTWTETADGTEFEPSDELKMVLTLGPGDTIPSEYSKIQFSITSEDNQNIRIATYTLVGTTNPTLYRIKFDTNVVVKNSDNQPNPATLSPRVEVYTADNITTHYKDVNGEGGFTLYFKAPGMNQKSSCPTDSSGNYAVPTAAYGIGEALEFMLNVDTNDGDTNTDTLMDKETIYIVGEGTGYNDFWLKQLLDKNTTISGALVMTGDLLARNADDKITAGILGFDYESVDPSVNVRFFAGNTGIVNLSDATAATFISKVKETPFRVTEGGKLYATDAVVSGSITATHLNVNLNNSSYDITTSAGLSNFLNAAGIGEQEDYTWLSAAFSTTSVTGGLIQTGNLLVKNSRGKIAAGVLGYESDATDDIRFFAGTTDLNTTASNAEIMSEAKNAPFRVYEDGTVVAKNISELNSANNNTSISSNGILYATGAQITGNIYALNSSGSITAGMIGTDMNSASTSDAKFFAGTTIASDATEATIMSEAKNAPFYVTESGELHASGAIISGSITATHLTINTGSRNYDLTNTTDASAYVNGFVNVNTSKYDWVAAAFDSTNIDGGLMMTGDLLVKDSRGYITGGVLGYNNDNADVRFFAGADTGILGNNWGLSNLISQVKSKATFRVDEDGTLYAKKGIFSGAVMMPYKYITDLNYISGSYQATVEDTYIYCGTQCTLTLPNPNKTTFGTTYHIIVAPKIMNDNDDTAQLTILSEVPDQTSNSPYGAFKLYATNRTDILNNRYYKVGFNSGCVEITCVGGWSGTWSNTYYWVVTRCNDINLYEKQSYSSSSVTFKGTYTNMWGYSPTKYNYAPCVIQTDANPTSGRRRDTIYITLE